MPDTGDPPPAHDDPIDERIADEANDWVMRMHGDQASLYAAAFKQWYEVSPDHARAYDACEATYRNPLLVVAGRSFGHIDLKRVWYADPRVIGCITAFFLAMLAVSCWAFLQRSLPQPEPTVYAATGQAVRQISLDDGSLVILDRNARIRVSLGDTHRRIALLAGRARFDVAHETKRDFVVTAGAGEVKAIGTLFEVQVTGTTASIRLLRGAIIVSGTQHFLPGQAEKAVRLAQGHGIEINARSQLSAILPLGMPANWATGLTAFDHVSVAAIVDAANRGAPPRIILSNPEIGHLRLSGTLVVRDNSALATQLAAAFDLQLSRNSAGDLIISRKK